jgi:hypothetical protein
MLLRLKRLEQEMERRREKGEKPLTNDEAMVYFRTLRDQEDAGNGTTDSRSAGLETDGCHTP